MKQILLFLVVLSFATTVKAQINIDNLMGNYDGTYETSFYSPFPYPHWVYDSGSMTVTAMAINDSTFSLSYGNKSCELFNDSSFFTGNPYCGQGKFYDSDYIQFCDGNGTTFGGGLSFSGKKTAVGVVEALSNKFLIYTDPISQKLIVTRHNNLKNIRLEIFNLLGQQVFQNVYNDNSSIEIDVSEYEKGIYLLKISNEEHLDVRKIIIK